ncbi:homeobox expressed in ES cells 1 [Notolabrus celidotus]|uniref:homeobox expressed in ES cells 1 n=1 Tax=Notolabrus celidotus TaxID=1203425 RepID=UPI0014908135|nr:homeobox expressed in ES cells 1 [Notolabrus celidotus]
MASTQAPVAAQSRPAFSIERILGLEVERPASCLKLHRPWTEIIDEKENRGNSLCSKQQQWYHHPPHHPHHPQQLDPNRPTSNWYIGRRPRTAFTNSQVKVLESVFQMNCYPGIQLREQLAGRLDLDEDRIQIWFQNRRAKLRRSLRESRLRLVQTAVVDLRVGRDVMGQLKAQRDERGDLDRASHLHLEGEEEEERC